MEPEVIPTVDEVGLDAVQTMKATSGAIPEVEYAQAPAATVGISFALTNLRNADTDAFFEKPAKLPYLATTSLKQSGEPVLPAPPSSGTAGLLSSPVLKKGDWHGLAKAFLNGLGESADAVFLGLAVHDFAYALIQFAFEIGKVYAAIDGIIAHPPCVGQDNGPDNTEAVDPAPCLWAEVANAEIRKELETIFTGSTQPFSERRPCGPFSMSSIEVPPKSGLPIDMDDWVEFE
ncbi:MAG: hypothetical protein P4N24_15690 [Acidobacteriota bacterium]|nr:hypothetical protein [Acidobacteriota bacterium]